MEGFPKSGDIGESERSQSHGIPYDVTPNRPRGFITSAVMETINMRSVEISILRATGIGSYAKQLLTSSGFSATVLSTTSQAVYLEGCDEEILWLAGTHTPAHRRGVQVALPGHEIPQGNKVWVSKGRLFLGEELAVDLTTARELAFPSPHDLPALPRHEVSVALRSILDSLGPCFESAGMGPLIPILAAMADGSDHKLPLPGDPMLVAAMEPFRSVASACFHGDLPSALKAAERLLGFGSGMTPSGDDFIGGLLFSLHWLQVAFPRQFEIDPQGIETLLGEARRQTHRISFTLMKDLAKGHGPEPVHTFMRALLQAESHERSIARARSVVKIGASTGWDVLLGMLTGAGSLIVD